MFFPYFSVKLINARNIDLTSSWTDNCVTRLDMFLKQYNVALEIIFVLRLKYSLLKCLMDV